MKSINNFYELNNSNSSLVEILKSISLNKNEKMILSSISSCTKLLPIASNVLTTEEFLYV